MSSIKAKAEAEFHSELVQDPERENPPLGNEREVNRGRRTHPLGGRLSAPRGATEKTRSEKECSSHHHNHHHHKF
jgi:hypothetical protein